MRETRLYFHSENCKGYKANTDPSNTAGARRGSGAGGDGARGRLFRSGARRGGGAGGDGARGRLFRSGARRGGSAPPRVA